MNFLTILSICTILLFGGCQIASDYHTKYIPSITIENKDGPASSYRPFTKSDKLSRLDEESTLKFTMDDKLPVVDGATALFPIYCSFVEAVYPSECSVNDCVKFSTTTGAYDNLIKADVDIIFVAGPSKKQLEKATEAGLEFNLHPIGYEAFVFIVNDKNPVDSLSVKQIKDIYTGEVTNWKQVGGKNWSIKVYQRSENSGSQTAFRAFMGKNADLITPESHEVMSMMDGIVTVVEDYRNHKNSIGFSFRYYIETMQKDTKVKMIKLNGIAPTAENIRNRTYPVTDNFYAVTIKGRESENTKKFLDWMVSEQGQKIIEKVGYVSLNEVKNVENKKAIKQKTEDAK